MELFVIIVAALIFVPFFIIKYTVVPNLLYIFLVSAPNAKILAEYAVVTAISLIVLFFFTFVPACDEYVGATAFTFPRLTDRIFWLMALWTAMLGAILRIFTIRLQNRYAIGIWKIVSLHLVCLAIFIFSFEAGISALSEFGIDDPSCKAASAGQSGTVSSLRDLVV